MRFGEEMGVSVLGEEGGRGEEGGPNQAVKTVKTQTEKNPIVVLGSSDRLANKLSPRSKLSQTRKLGLF